MFLDHLVFRVVSRSRVSRDPTILSPKAKDLAANIRDSQAQISASGAGILRRKRLRIVSARETRQKLGLYSVNQLQNRAAFKHHPPALLVGNQN
jgi:hypothetical protein